MKKRILLLIIVLVGAAFAYWQWQSTEPLAARYRLENVSEGGVTQTVSANGTLNPVVLISVGTQVSGTVKKLYVDFNDKVKANDPLLELDDSLLAAIERQSAANMLSARASLDLARANAVRMKNLLAKDYVSRQEFDQSEQVLKSAEAAVALAKAQNDRDNANLSYTVIRSPVDGIVVDRVVDLGQTVAASFQTPTLIKIAQDLTQMSIDTSFAEADIGNIREGQTVRFTVDAFPDRQFKGSVLQIRLNPSTQQNVVTYNVRIVVENADYLLLPGMTAYVNIAVQKREKVLLVPNAALRFKPPEDTQAESKRSILTGAGSMMPGPPATRQPGGNRQGGKKESGQGGTVYVIEGDALKAISVRLGITDNRNTEITSGELAINTPLIVGENFAHTGKKSTLNTRMF